MTLRAEVEKRLTVQVSEFTVCAEFRALESGRIPREDCDRFIANVVRAHLMATQLVAFLYALAPPVSAESRLRNLLEELSHPGLLRQFAAGAGLADLLPVLEVQAAADIRQVVGDPLLYGTLKEVGLAVLGEVVAFEYMLSRVSGRVATALARHRGLPRAALRWWTEHSEVDVQHAEEGLADLDAYVAYYDLPEEDARAIVETALRENVFIKRYFGELPLARATGMIEA